MARRRPTLPELWGWAEFLEASDRTDTGLRYLQGAYPEEFPQPVVELRMGPIFLAAECREFLAAHPKVGPAVAQERAVFAMRDAGISVVAISENTGVSVPTIYRWLAKRRRR